MNARKALGLAAVVVGALAVDEWAAWWRRRQWRAVLQHMVVQGKADGILAALLGGRVTEGVARERFPDPDVWEYLERSGRLAIVRATGPRS